MNFAPAHSPFEENAPEFADVREAAALAAAGQRLDRAAAEALGGTLTLHWEIEWFTLRVLLPQK